MILPSDTVWLADPKAQALFDAFDAAGRKLFFVGGCVRNAVLREAVSDVDLSTDAHPSEVTRIAEARGFKPVPTGIDHGTVTVVVEGTPYEITTFRRDVETDGRRAVVAFSNDIEDDARRRDFTMNALYAQRDGVVVDPLGGLPDTLARRVRFIEDAGQRIREDYLRALRFFRFSAWYAEPGEGFDADMLAAIAEHLDGLETLSAERVGTELLKLLAAPDPAPAVATMGQIGIFVRLMPLQSPQALAPLIHAEGEADLAPDPIRRLAALNPQDARERFRLSKKQAADLASLIEARDGTWGPRALGHKLGAERGWDALVLRMAGMGQPVDKTQKPLVAKGAAAEFPIKPADLMPDFQGPALGQRLRDLEARWLASDLKLNRDDLLG